MLGVSVVVLVLLGFKLFVFVRVEKLKKRAERQFEVLRKFECGWCWKEKGRKVTIYRC